MKRVFVACLALVLAGCATIQNPLGPADIYRTRTLYAATLELANGYREFCYARPYAVLMRDPIARPVCQKRRAVVRALQSADDKAFASIQTAEKFIVSNPELGVKSLDDAWTAVTAFRAIAASKSIPAK